MLDRFKLDQFYQPNNTGPVSLNVQEFTESVYTASELQIATLAMDLPGKSPAQRKAIEKKWIEILPTLDHVKSLSIRHRVNPDFFDAICKMKNVERLVFWSSTVEDISAISQLDKLRRLKLSSFNRLTNISPLVFLKNLVILSIDNCFNVENYEIIGKMTQLIGLELGGDTFAPRRLRIKSLVPLETLQNLKHLDLSSASVIDNSYESILKMDSLERFDLVVNIPKEIRDKIKLGHKKLQAGFFVDYDFENKKFYDGKQW